MELLIGALCVGFMRRFVLHELTQRIVSWMGFAAIAVSLVVLNDRTPFPGLWALLPCLGTAAVLVAPQGDANRLISVRPMVWVGDISYSLYLWHWPLLVYAHMAFGLSVAVTAAAVVLAFILAGLSRRYVEEPWLRPQPRPVWIPAAVATAVSIGICVFLYNMNGLPQRFSPAERALFAAVEDHNPDRDRCHKRSNRDMPYAGTCTYGAAAVPPSVAIWSDSLGAELAPALGAALGQRGQSLRSITASGCAAGLGRVDGDSCERHQAQVLAGLGREEGVGSVLLLADWDKDPSSKRVADTLTAALALKQQGKQVILVLPFPEFDYDPPSEAGLAGRLGRDPAQIGLATADYRRLNAPLEAHVRAFATAHGIEVFDPQPLLCGPVLCPIYDADEGVLYFDHVHPSLTGARRLVPSIMRMLPPPDGAPR